MPLTKIETRGGLKYLTSPKSLYRAKRRYQEEFWVHIMQWINIMLKDYNILYWSAGRSYIIQTNSPDGPHVESRTDLIDMRHDKCRVAQNPP
ncbi:hypothetical protein RRG08_016228 [Elysia crispata]|uniref:Uncharacterized protein n=1 Tax=Elysia crispata TaxID=231223 RepID=A0AAE0ZPL7_9GAST|nr:hypothetical protein RRG08_016228 [Elysia crispata]